MVERASTRAEWADLLVRERPPEMGVLPWLCARCAVVTEVSSGAVSMATSSGLLATVTASGPLAAQAEGLQTTLGEGPGVEALGHGMPVLVADLAELSAAGRRSWPAFSLAALQAGIRAVFAFPLQVGAVRLGALDLYRSCPGQLTDDQLTAALVAADLAAAALLHMDGRADASGELPGNAGDEAGYRLEVHQAAGMVMVQLGTNIDAALARLRAHAFASDQPLDRVAADVVASRLRFEPEEGE